MKSKIEQIESRGFVAAGIENKYPDTTFEHRINLLKSKSPTDRAIGARLLAKNPDLSATGYLIDALINEKKLYSKIEICNSLVSFGTDAVMPLIGLLGKIGNNQHKEVPKTDFKKHNYPLPRDIAGRALIRIGPKAIPYLLKVLDTNNMVMLSEAIDAIGFICYYEPQINVYRLLKKCFDSNQDNNLIKWKIYRAMSAFPESVSFLTEQLQLSKGPLKSEIERSLSLLKKRVE
jgi:hypothetical protein